MIRETAATTGSERFLQIEFSLKQKVLLLRTDQQIYSNAINSATLTTWSTASSSLIYSNWISVIYWIYQLLIFEKILFLRTRARSFWHSLTGGSNPTIFQLRIRPTNNSKSQPNTPSNNLSWTRHSSTRSPPMGPFSSTRYSGDPSSSRFTSITRQRSFSKEPRDSISLRYYQNSFFYLIDTKNIVFYHRSRWGELRPHKQDYEPGRHSTVIKNFGSWGCVGKWHGRDSPRDSPVWHQYLQPVPDQLQQPVLHPETLHLRDSVRVFFFLLK